MAGASNLMERRIKSWGKTKLSIVLGLSELEAPQIHSVVLSSDNGARRQSIQVPPTSTVSIPFEMAAVLHTIKALLAQSERHTMHLSRVLSTTEGTEATLCTLFYALTLVHARLAHSLEQSYERLAEDIVAKASKIMMPGETVAAHLEPPHVGLRDSCESVKSASELVYNVRCFLRLWGVVRIYEHAKRVYAKSPRDPIIKLLVWAQLGAKATYQVLENGAFLTSVGVFRSKKWLSREQNWWTWSNKAWLVYVVLETLRLLRVRQLRFNEDFGAERHQQIEVQSEELKKRWYRDFYANAGWVAPTIHLSQYNPLASPIREEWVGLSGLIPGFIAFQDAWEKTG